MVTHKLKDEKFGIIDLPLSIKSYNYTTYPASADSSSYNATGLT
jgi:hypothetical protein